MVNATHVTRQVRGRWIDLGTAYDARIEIVYVEKDLQTILNQNVGRATKSVVPEQVIQRLVDKLDPPTFAECHDLVLG